MNNITILCCILVIGLALTTLVLLPREKYVHLRDVGIFPFGMHKFTRRFRDDGYSDKEDDILKYDSGSRFYRDKKRH